MDTTVKEVLDFVQENDVKFIRLAFCDLLGRQKNISIMPHELQDAFEDGVSFDSCAIKGFSDGTKSDLFLYPDPTTLTVLSWRPQQGRVVRFHCDIKNPDRSIFACDTRGILKRAIKRCEEKGYICKVGVECEFYLFKTDADGEPTNIPFDTGSYFDISPLDKCEDVRREICLSLEEMGIYPERSHHEQGPGQNEINFKFSDALGSADNLLTFKTVVKAIAARNGLFASFMPKPLADKSGSGLHISLSLSQNGYNIFKKGNDEHSKTAESFIAGILEKSAEITAFLNPIPNSYERFGAFEAPKYVSWSHANRSQLVRIPAATGEKMRMELRSPDPAVNPYLAFALIINAGLNGIEKELTLPPEVDVDLYNTDESITNTLSRLPANMADALALAKNSAFVKKSVGAEVLSKFIAYKEQEEKDLSLSENKEDFYMQTYFKII